MERPPPTTKYTKSKPRKGKNFLDDNLFLDPCAKKVFGVTGNDHQGGSQVGWGGDVPANFHIGLNNGSINFMVE